MILDNKILDIVKRRNFQSFWECFDYLKLASYDEIEALLASLEIFEGKIWDNVITSAKCKAHNSNSFQMSFATGGTYNYASSGSTTITGAISGYDDDLSNLVGEPDNHRHTDDLLVQLYIMTDKANKHYADFYKSYIKIRSYSEIKEIEDHFKIVTINLTTEAAIQLFNDGYDKYK